MKVKQNEKKYFSFSLIAGHTIKRRGILEIAFYEKDFSEFPFSFP